MWQRFTERARKAVFYAQEEARKNGEMYVSTEHLLLALTREDDHVAAKILDRLGITLTQVRVEVRKNISPGSDKLGADMQLTPRAKRVIDLAYDEARLLRNNYIGTEHLLLGMVREGEGLAGRVLATLGVKLEDCRREVVGIQNEKKPDQGSSDELLNMDDAAKFLGVSKPTLYRFLSSGELKGVKVGRQWRFRKEDLAAYLGRESGGSEAPAQEIDDELSFFQGQIDREGQPSSPLNGDDTESKLKTLAHDLIKLAIIRSASDIHIEPVRQPGSAHTLVRIRIDGALHELRRMPPAVGEMLVARLKAMADIDLNTKSAPQEGRIPIQFQFPRTLREDRTTVQTQKSPPAFPKKIGSLDDQLLKRGHITEDQLRQAREVQKSAPGDIGQIIVDLGFATERDICSARATEMGLPFVDLTKNYPIDPSAVRLVPEEVARRLNILALRVDFSGRIWVAVGETVLETMQTVLAEIGKLTKHTPLPVLAAPGAMKEAIDRAYKNLPAKSPVPARPDAARREVIGGIYTIILQTLPTAHGEAVTMRITEVPKEMTSSLDDLGFSEEQLLSIRDWVKRPRGLIVGVGPEGSGKTTPLYAMLKVIAGPTVKTVAFADPPVDIPYVTPIALGETAGTMYPETLRPVDALRAMYRGGDPDVVFYDIVKDSETAKLIVEIGITGHLVLTTVEAASLSAAGEKFNAIEPLLLTRALVGVIVQRLAVKICPNCKEKVATDPRDPAFQRIHQMAMSGGYVLMDNAAFYHGKGCAECKGRGWRGRVGLFQVITWNDTYSQALLSGATAEEIERLAVAMGSPTVLADAIRKAALGEITIDEAIRVGSM